MEHCVFHHIVLCVTSFTICEPVMIASLKFRALRFQEF